jgi:hypothetical protein
LEGLHKRSGVALAVVQHYRWKVALRCCGQQSPYLEDFANLVDRFTEAKAIVSFSYEKISDNSLFVNDPIR